MHPADRTARRTSEREDSKSQEEQELVTDEDDEGGFEEEKEVEDVSSRWSEEERKQAVEALLGSCAGRDFLEESEPSEVTQQSKSALRLPMHL